MGQIEFIELQPEERRRHGAAWWSGSWECRNFHGYYQVREQGRGNWQFIIYGFGDHKANVYRVNDIGELYRENVPIDAKTGSPFWVESMEGNTGSIDAEILRQSLASKLAKLHDEQHSPTRWRTPT